MQTTTARPQPAQLTDQVAPRRSATIGRPERVVSIDVLRGLTIALMILVNDPGDWSHVYSQLDHAAWNGFTVTDFVFPNFLFLVGVSIILSLQARIARCAAGTLDPPLRRSLALHMFRRAFTLFAIKMFLSAFPHFHWTHLRIFGVLTRIAVCYLIAGLICLALWNKRHRAGAVASIAAAFLIGYWILMRFVPVAGFGVPTHSIAILDPNANLAAWLDRGFNTFTQHTIHTGSLYNHTRDPEGLLSTIPAIATTLIGCVTGLYLRRPQQSRLREGATAANLASHSTFLGLLVTGILCLIAGLAWNLWFPINKNLWTSSYVLYSAGWSLLLFALCYWLIDVRRVNDRAAGTAVLWPWLVFGSNAITAFIISNFVVELLIWIKVPAGALVRPGAPATRITAWLWPYLHLFARHGSTKNTSLAFAIAFTALCIIPNWILWRKRVFLKV